MNLLKKNIVLFFSLITILFCCNIGTLVVKADTSFVSESKASELTHNFANSLSSEYDWSNSEVIFKSPLYDVDDSMLGYYFEVRRDSTYLGYIITSATTEREPILQYGDGTFQEQPLVEGEKLYLLNPFTTMAAKNKEALQQKIDDIQEDLIMDVESDYSTGTVSSTEYQEMLSEVTEFELLPLEKNVIDSSTQWNSLKSITPQPTVQKPVYRYGDPTVPSAMTKESTFSLDFSSISTEASTVYASSLKSGDTLPITRIWQRTSGVSKPKSACGPTVADMINNYYKSEGYNVRNSTYYGGNVKYINRMITSMKTGVFGTTTANFRDELRRQLNINYPTSTSPWKVWIHPANGYFETYKSYLKSERPVALRFNNIFKTGSESYKWHYVLGVGYTASHAIILDPDGGKTNTRSTKISWSLYQKNISMIFTQPY